MLWLMHTCICYMRVFIYVKKVISIMSYNVLCQECKEVLRSTIQPAMLLLWQGRTYQKRCFIITDTMMIFRGG